MKVLLFGATGGTGRHVLTQALEAGHHVTVFARNPAAVTTRHEHLRVVAGDVTAGDATLAVAVQGQDAVISALGRGQTFNSGNLIQQSAPAIVKAMRARDVSRLIFTSALGVGESIQDAPLFMRLMIRFPLRGIYADKKAGEAHIRNSDLDWTLVQPVQLTDGGLTRHYRAGERLPLRGIVTISRADTAHFIVDQLTDPSYIRKVALLAY
ncbi:MAG: SDR family oxidoreductase [Vicinamibacterales bacterium]